MSQSSDLFFTASVLIPALILIGLISGRKLADVMETSTGKAVSVRLFNHAPFEWAMFCAVALLFCCALTGISAYAIRDGSALFGGISGVFAALFARGAVRLPIEHDNFRGNSMAMILPPIMSGALGAALSQFYSPAVAIY